jgi:hypothetical protein
MTQDPTPAEPRGSGTDQLHEDQQLLHRSQPVGAAKDEVPLSDATQIQAPLQVSREKRSFEDIYGDRLKVIWDAAHVPGQEDEQEWRTFREAMLRVAQTMPLVDADIPALAVAGAGIEGNIVNVDLTIRDRVRQESSPPAVAAFLKDVLAPTMARLERESQGTPERRVDIIVLALSGLESAPPAADLALELTRYLQTQDPDERGVGYYTTVGSLAGVVALSEERHHQEEAAFLYHLVLRGIRSIAIAESLEDFTTMASEAVSISAFNLGAIISDLLQRDGKDGSAEGTKVAQDLNAISVSSTELVQFDDRRAAEIVQALGFQTERATEVATVLEYLGNAARAWDDRPIAAARLAAARGAIIAAAPEPENPASSLFNAGVYLNRSDDSPPLLLSRILMNALGLRLALVLGPDLVTSLVRLAGLDCAVNLVGAFNRYSRIGAPDIKAAIEPLARKLISLGDWSPLRTAGRDVNADLGRLAVSAEGLGVRSEGEVSPDLSRSLDDAIDGIRSNTGGPDALDDVVMDSAQLIGHTFAAVLPASATSGLEETVERVTASRDRPVDILIQRYEDYSNPPDHPVGIGPLQPAGVLESSEWAQLAARLLQPIGSVAPALRAFQLQ